MGLLRVILAMSVVLTHVGGISGYYMAGSTPSVQMFYIISGFYMATVLTEKYDPRTDIGIFYANRSLRIYSIYFVALFITVAGHLALQNFFGQDEWLTYIANTGREMSWPEKAWLIFAGLFIIGQGIPLFLRFVDGHLAFTPYGPGIVTPVWKLMPIPPAWSVSLELMFYCFVPFLIRNGTRILIAIFVGALLLRVAIYSAGYDQDPWQMRFFPMELGLFVLGMLARRVYDAHITKIEKRRQVLVVSLFLGVTCIFQPILDLTSVSDALQAFVVLIYYLSASIALPCLFQLTRHSKIDGAIGNFSYPLYLIHWIVFKSYEAFAGRYGWPGHGSLTKTAACVAVSLLVAWLIVVGVEKPVDRFRHRKIAHT